jgi:hypothetical protein
LDWKDIVKDWLTPKPNARLGNAVAHAIFGPKAYYEVRNGQEFIMEPALRTGENPIEHPINTSRGVTGGISWVLDRVGISDREADFFEKVAGTGEIINDLADGDKAAAAKKAAEMSAVAKIIKKGSESDITGVGKDLMKMAAKEICGSICEKIAEPLSDYLNKLGEKLVPESKSEPMAGNNPQRQARGETLIPKGAAGADAIGSSNDPGWDWIWTPTDGYVGQYFYDANGNVKRTEWAAGYKAKGNEVFAGRGGAAGQRKGSRGNDSTITSRDYQGTGGQPQQSGQDDNAMIDPATGQVYDQWHSSGQLGDSVSLGPPVQTQSIQIFIEEWMKNRNQVGKPPPNYTGASRSPGAPKDVPNSGNSTITGGTNTAKLDGSSPRGSDSSPPGSDSYVPAPNLGGASPPSTPRIMIGPPPRTATGGTGAVPPKPPVPKGTTPQPGSTITGTGCIDACSGANASVQACESCRAAASNGGPPPAKDTKVAQPKPQPKMPDCPKSSGQICGTEQTSGGTRTHWCCSPWTCDAGNIRNCNPPSR